MRRLVPAAPNSGRGQESTGAAANEGGSGHASSPRPQIGVSRKREKTTNAACLSCRSRKCKCDGLRPICTACQTRQLECKYDAAFGISWRQQLRSQRAAVVQKASDLELVMNALQTGSDQDATTLLARLRLGEDIPALAESLKKGIDHETSGLLQANQHAADAISPIVADMNSSSFPNVRTGTFFSPSFDRRELLGIPADDDDDEMSTNDTESDNPPNRDTGSRQHSDSPFGNAIPSAYKEFLRAQLANLNLESSPLVDHVQLSSNLQNLFGNMPFSSSVFANYHTQETQAQQIQNLSVPAWAMKICHSKYDGTDSSVFTTILEDTKALLDSGAPAEQVFGHHPHIAALFDEDAFLRAPPLSQWAARVVHSVKQNNYDFTLFASMSVFWLLTRWMAQPTPEYYKALPSWLRPVPNQYFMPHPMVVDYVVWPAFRELCVRAPALQAGMEWAVETSITIDCKWEGTAEDSLCTDIKSGELDLCEAAKDALYRLEGWTVAPSFRKHIPNADSYVIIDVNRTKAKAS